MHRSYQRSRVSCTDHEMSDLEELLDEVIQVDFHVQAEDDSPYMVARSLVNMYNQVANGDSSYVDTLRQQHQDRAALDKSVRDPGASHGGDFMGDSSSSDDDEEEEQGEAGSAEVGIFLKIIMIMNE